MSFHLVRWLLATVSGALAVRITRLPDPSFELPGASLEALPSNRSAIAALGASLGPCPRGDCFEHGSLMDSAPFAKNRTEHFLLERLERLLLALGGGTGLALPSDEESETFEKRRRTYYQTNALAFVLVGLYFAVLAVGASYLRWKLDVRTDISYFSCEGEAAVQGHDARRFLDAFNNRPKQVTLQVTGSSEDEEELTFNFALDLSHWVVPEEWADCCAESVVSPSSRVPLFGGLEASEMERLQEFLEKDRNDLATVVLYKHVAWPDWEDVATNIRQRIKQCGFERSVSVRCDDLERITVHKNKAWAHFMNHRTTPVLCMLSIVGWPLYLVYTSWWRTELPIHAHFRVDVSVEDFWALVSDQLGATGFETTDSGSTGGSVH